MFSIEILQFGQLLDLIARHAQTPMGRRRILKLCPLAGRRQLEQVLSAVSETNLLGRNNVVWRFSEMPDPGDAIAVLKIRNTALDPLSMLEITRLCNQALFAQSLISPEKENAPTLWQIVENIPKTLFDVLAGIGRKLLPSGELEDSASPELARLRREITAQRGRLQKSLESLIRAKGDAIQDAIVTVRNDRYVIPVKSDFSGKVQGVAHGSSSSGATVFIEPLEAIAANNELQSLKGKEEREVSRILFALTEELREQLPAIEAAAEAVAELDFIRAKVEFARTFDAIVPEISDDETLDLANARHPLLEESLRSASMQDKKENNPKSQIGNPKSEGIVPISFKLSKDEPVMIISGANAGGKTVVLKTAGLLSLMAISGLPVPAKAARVPFYRSVLADIGDHQSISANLSTFSSHISNIAEMMRVCDAPSLVLLDEVGTGTDPDEGSALGVAIVDYFRRKCRAQVMASTHYRGLKIYAANDDQVINASVEFDEKTLAPTYRLLTGLAGASSGIEIAGRFGILDVVIEDARGHLDISAKEAANYLKKLQTETAQATDLRIALEEEREAVATKYARLDIEARKREKERQKEFENELAETLQGFDRQSKALIKTIEDKALKNKLEKERLARKAELNRAVFSRLSGEAAESEPSAAADATNADITNRTNRPIAEGARVLTPFGKIGRVEKIDGAIAEVLVGSMRLREKLSNLKAVADQVGQTDLTRAEKLQKQMQGSNLRVDAPDAAVELNLIGQTTSDAEYELDRFLDESYIAALPQVRIIHGFGTGALKNFVHHFLKGHPHVEKFGFAPRDQGGNGATVVEMKK